jgi:hypothetical protein
MTHSGTRCCFRLYLSDRAAKHEGAGTGLPLHLFDHLQMHAPPHARPCRTAINFCADDAAVSAGFRWS